MFFILFFFLILPKPFQAHHHAWLVEIWAPGYCSENGSGCRKDEPLPKDFTIHGLWPTDQQGNTLLNCQTPVRDVHSLLQGREKLVQDLTMHWQNLNAKTSETGKQMDFWKHEWLKHGSCLERYNPLGYFGKGILLRLDNSGLLHALASNGLVPGASYPKADYENAINGSRTKGHAFALRCINKNGQILLKEIYICYAKDLYTVISCSNTEISNIDNCRANSIIKFPSQVE